MSTIICGFPGVGKRYIEEHKDQLGINSIFLDPYKIEEIHSDFSKGIRRVNWVNLYFKMLLEVYFTEQYEYVIAVSTIDLRDRLYFKSIPYMIAYPSKDIPYETYIKRFNARPEIDRRKYCLSIDYDDYLNSCIFDHTPIHLVISNMDHYLSDFLIKKN